MKGVHAVGSALVCAAFAACHALHFSESSTFINNFFKPNYPHAIPPQKFHDVSTIQAKLKVKILVN